jgi:hypothetical protein
VIDNLITINGQNACVGVSAANPGSCFGPVLDTTLPRDVPIENVLAPVTPVDVSKLIPIGTNYVLFELRDFGTVAGNTDVYLVTTAKPILPQPFTIAQQDASHLTVSGLAPDGRSIDLNVTLARAAQSFRGTLAIANTPVLHIRGELPRTVRGSNLRATTRFDQAFTGVEATFTENNGLLSGQIAGRDILPVVVTTGAVAPTPAFVDGAPPPVMPGVTNDLIAISAFVRGMQQQGPLLSKMSEVDCSSNCIETACNAAKAHGFNVAVLQRPNGQVTCMGTDDADAAEDYRQEYNQCYDRMCNLLGVFTKEVFNEILPAWANHALDYVIDLTTRRRR